MAPSRLLRRLDRAVPAIAAVAAVAALTALALRAFPPVPAHVRLATAAATPATATTPTTATTAAAATAATAAAAAAAVAAAAPPQPPPPPPPRAGGSPPRRGVLVPPDPTGGMAPPPGTRLVFIDATVAATATAGVDWWARAPRSVFGARAHVTSAAPADYDVYVFAPDAAAATAAMGGGRVHVVPALPAAVDAPAGARSSGSGGGGDDDGGAAAAAARVDFAAWLRRTFPPDAYLLCRLDLEGAEAAVLRRLLVTGLLCRCARLSVEWHMWVGTTAEPHGTHFNDPAQLEADDNVLAAAAAGGKGATDGGQGGRVACTIPHLRRALSHTECVLPRVVAWARRACPPPAAPMERWL